MVATGGAAPMTARAPRASLPAGFATLMAAQFACALADNALLIVTMALLQHRGMPPWWAPLLKLALTVSYVAFAPFVGPLADAYPKARLMAWMNVVKIAGIAALLLGLHPVLAFAVVGFASAAHAPAKYGLVTELVGAHGLVRANGWLEVSVVCAVLLGTVAGGVLVSPGVTGGPLGTGCRMVAACQGLAGGPLTGSLAVVLTVYGAAAVLSLAVPDSGARYPGHRRDVRALTRDFVRANRTLWADPDGGLSLAVTTVFWGVGATLQFAVLRWAGEALRLPLSECAYLQAAVAVGVVGGAAAAARWVPLHHAKRVLGAGVVLGALTPLIAITTRWPWAVAGLTLLGIVGGVLVVPLNALLQQRGYALLSAGRSVAVQGFNENASVLVMLGVYAAMIDRHVPIVNVMGVFGLATATVMLALMAREFQTRRRVRADVALRRGLNL